MVPEERKARTELISAIAKLVLAIAALVPALGMFLISNSKADHALSAVAHEKAAGDESYEAIAARLNKAEEERRKLALEVAEAREITIKNHPADRAEVSTSAPSLDELKRSPPAPPLPVERPAPSLEKVNQAAVKIEAAQKAAGIEVQAL